MFFLVVLERTIKLAPKHFGPKLEDTLLKTISQELEGTCTGRYGFVGKSRHTRRCDAMQSLTTTTTTT
jgi:DNA-directed RNA polymerase subunit E'/Rpb7